MAAVELPDLSSASGLQEFNEYLSSRRYVSGDQPSKDDVVVFCALSQGVEGDLNNVSRWHDHISSLLQKYFPGNAVGVKIAGSPAAQTRELAVEAPPPAPKTPVAAEAEDDDAGSPAAQTRELTVEAPPPAPKTPVAAEAEDDDEDIDLFGEETEEEKQAAAEREQKKASSTKKRESGKSSVLLDVKPWDDETDMVKVEEAVRSVAMPGLFWGASKLVPVGYGIKKLQIMMTIVDDLVSVDNLIEDYLIEEPRNEHIQSCDIVAFNKI